MSNSLWPHGLHSPWNSPGRNTGVGSPSLLQGIFPTKFLTRGFMSSSKMVKVTEFEELCNTVVDNWNMSVGSGRVVQSRLALTSLTCIQSCVCGSGGDFHPDCLGLEQLTWASIALSCLSSSSAASRFSHAYPSHGNGQSARQQVETRKGSWNLDLEMVPSYFHLILLAKVTWLNSITGLEYRPHSLWETVKNLYSKECEYTEGWERIGDNDAIYYFISI